MSLSKSAVPDPGSGSGSSLPSALLYTSLACTLFATLFSTWSIYLHLKGYRRPALQRLVVRIMVMIPLYAISSLVSLHSLEAAFWIDAVRDLYEAFVIYTFFSLLVTYLGGERSLLILLHGRPPTLHPWPVSIFIHEMDGSDPYTYLGLKRGILQYVWVKPILALVTLILKLTDTYADGKLSFHTPYTYVSIVYNASITLSLYCLAMFWVAIHHDVRPFRPTPKFLCVKGILFFSFWQGIFISVLVASGAIKKVGVYTDEEHMSLALGDLLICFEMPLFAIAHADAFCRLDDYVDPALQYVARMPFLLALRDSVGLLDVYFDFKATAQGRGMSYRSFEPVEGAVHSLGLARERRIRAGLRYERGGKGKYWLPVPRGDGGILGGMGRDYGSLGNSSNPVAPLSTGVVNKAGHGPHSKGYRSPPLQNGQPLPDDHRIEDSDDETDSVTSLEFFALPADASGGGDEDDEEERRQAELDEQLYEHARGMLHGDWAYRVVDVSREMARNKMRAEEENVLAGYGRDGRGRRRGEVWGRGLTREADAEGGTTTKKEPKRKVYGAWGQDDERLIDSIYPSIGRKHSANGNGKVAPSSSTHRPPTPPLISIDDGEGDSPTAWRGSDSSPRSSPKQKSPSSKSRTLVSPLPSPDAVSDLINLPWAAKGKGVAGHFKHSREEFVGHLKHGSEVLSELAHQVPMPATKLEFSRPSSPNSMVEPNLDGEGDGPMPGEAGAILPSDAVDLIVPEPEMEHPGRRRASSSGQDGDYRRADFVDRETGKGQVVKEEIDEEQHSVITRTTDSVPLLNPPSSPLPPPSPNAALPSASTISTSSSSRSPWFDNSTSHHVREASDESNPWR